MPEGETRLPIEIRLHDDLQVVGADCDLLDLEPAVLVLCAGEWQYRLPLHRIAAVRVADTRVIVEFSNPDAIGPGREARFSVEPMAPTPLARNQLARDLCTSIRDARTQALTRRFTALEERQGFLRAVDPAEPDPTDDSEPTSADRHSAPSSSSLEFVAAAPVLSEAAPGDLASPPPFVGTFVPPRSLVTNPLQLVDPLPASSFSAPPTSEMWQAPATSPLWQATPTVPYRARAGRDPVYRRDDTDLIQRTRQTRNKPRENVPMGLVALALLIVALLALMAWNNFNQATRPQTPSSTGVRTHATTTATRIR